jgi:hypothetical protein
MLYHNKICTKLICLQDGCLHANYENRCQARKMALKPEIGCMPRLAAHLFAPPCPLVILGVG